jgi:hypothetical protein
LIVTARPNLSWHYDILKNQSSKNGYSKKWKGWKNLINYIKWKS